MYLDPDPKIRPNLDPDSSIFTQLNDQIHFFSLQFFFQTHLFEIYTKIWYVQKSSLIYILYFQLRGSGSVIGIRIRIAAYGINLERGFTDLALSCEVEKAVVTGSCLAAESSTPPGLNIYIEDRYEL